MCSDSKCEFCLASRELHCEATLLTATHQITLPAPSVVSTQRLEETVIAAHEPVLSIHIPETAFVLNACQNNFQREESMVNSKENTAC